MSNPIQRVSDYDRVMTILKTVIFLGIYVVVLILKFAEQA